MTHLHGVWPNTTRLLVAYLGDRTGLPVYSRRPPDGWEKAAPCIFLDRIPGPASDGLGISKTYTYSIEAMSADEDAVDDLQSTLEILMWTLPSESDTTAYVDEVDAVAQFAEQPFDDDAIDARLLRVAGVFDITVRPQPLPKAPA